MAKKPMDKGGRAEEAIRCAFLERGYFAVRGLPYRFAGFEITDVDLLLFGTTGSAREIINVDVKNKKTPQAMERLFWAMGIRSALRCDRCIVVTSETNPAVVEFGRRFGVTVLDGRYLQSIIDKGIGSRISEEDFIEAMYSNDAPEFSDALRMRYLSAKSRLLTLRGFDACNTCLRDVGDSLADLLAYPSCHKGVRRVLFAVAAFLCINLDAQWVKSDFTDGDKRVSEMDRGLRYGSAGRQRIEDFIRTLRQCRSDDATVSGVIDRIESQIEADTKEIRTDIVADFVGKWGSELFPLALAFDSAAFALQPLPITDLEPAAKSFLFMLTDYFELDRVKIAAC